MHACRVINICKNTKNLATKFSETKTLLSSLVASIQYSAVVFETKLLLFIYYYIAQPSLDGLGMSHEKAASPFQLEIS